MLKSVGCALLLGAAVGQGAERGDLARARTRKPGAGFRGDGQTELSRVLNRALRSTEVLTLACDAWSADQLQGFLATVFEARSPELDAIYQEAVDWRRLRRGSLPEHRAHWWRANNATRRAPHLHKPLRDSHCRQAVMWWTHHLTEATRQELRGRRLTVPLLPEEPKAACESEEGDEDARALCLGAEQENSCDWCHSLQSESALEGKHPPNALLPQFVGPDDGNPHGWDRARRCDQDYKSPMCGICEGVGGNAWSDKNEDIHIASCTPLKKPEEVNMSTVHWPIYPKQFTHRKYKDVLVGRKNDPFCFGFFPENNSSGVECYRAEDGVVKYYDIEKEAVRTDYNIRSNGAFGYLGNITSTVTHVGRYMWIINRLWGGLHQCICTDPGRTKCSHAPNCPSYVWHYDFAKDAQYLGRERLDVEWVGEMELDHFILWAHHMWTDPKTGRPVRFWKPWNGLQIYDPSGWEDKVEDPSVFEIPPAMCKKGGAKIRISCDDDGNFKPESHEGLEILEELRKAGEREEELFV